MVLDSYINKKVKHLLVLSVLVIVSCAGTPSEIERCKKYCLPSDVDCTPKCYLVPKVPPLFIGVLLDV